MDVSEEDHKVGDTLKADSKPDGDLVREKIGDESSKPQEEIPDKNSPEGLVSEKLEEEKTGLDPVNETEPSVDFTKLLVSVSKEFVQATKDPVEDSPANENKQFEEEINGVSGAGKDSGSTGIDSLSGQNGASRKWIETASEENNEGFSTVAESAPTVTEEAVLPVSDADPEEEESSGAADLVSNRAAGDIPPPAVARGGVEDSNSHIPEVPESTENQAYVTPRLLQRTSWGGCCGLFDFLRRSDH
ncbi:hypothetical protein U1Q18_001835 [Sarracenia purpurea var. burkii]